MALPQHHGGLTWEPFQEGLGETGAGHYVIERMDLHVGPPLRLYAMPIEGGLFEIELPE